MSNYARAVMIYWTCLSKKFYDYFGKLKSRYFRPSVAERYMENSMENKTPFLKQIISKNSSAPAVKDVSIINKTRECVIVSNESYYVEQRACWIG